MVHISILQNEYYRILPHMVAQIDPLSPPAAHRTSYHSSSHHPTFYATGTTNDGSSVLAVISPMSKKNDHHTKGWRCRSTHAAYMQVDYVNSETVHDVCRWIDHDLKHPFHLTMNREEILEHLSTHWTSLVEHQGWLAPDPQLPESEAVERVLQHLERGW